MRRGHGLRPVYPDAARHLAALLCVTLLFATIPLVQPPAALAAGTTYTWTGHNGAWGSDWSNAGTWDSSPDGVPGTASTDIVVIPSGTGHVCNFNYPSGTKTVASVTAAGTLTVNDGGTLAVTDVVVNSGGVVTITGGTLSATNVTVNAGGTLSVTAPGALTVTNLTVAGGTVTINPATSIPTVVLSSGTLNGSGQMTITNSFTFSGGTLSGASTTVIASGKSMTVSGTGSKNLGRAITNNGTIAFTGTGTMTASGASILNAGTIDFQADASLAGGTSITNNGTLKKSGGTGTSNIGPTVTNSGTIQSDSATLALTLSAANLSGGTLAGGSYTVTHGGVLQLPNAVTTNNATITLDGASSALRTSSADALANLATNGTVGRITLKGGKTLNTSAAFTNAGRIDLLGASNLHTASNLTLQSTSILSIAVSGNVSGTGYGQLQAGAAASLAGTLSADFSYTHASTDRLKVVTFGSRTGGTTFAHVVTSLVSGDQPTTEYNTSDVTLSWQTTLISVSIDTTAVPFGVMPANATSTSPVVVTATNNGNVAERFQITGSRGVGRGGGTWDLSTTAQGADAYRMRAIANSSFVDLATSAVNFPGNPTRAVGASQPFQLWLGMPSSSSVPGTYEMTVTITAVAAN